MSDPGGLPHPPIYFDWMREALSEASSARANGDVPVGAIVVGDGGNVVARAHNERELRADPTAHAEVLALRMAAQVVGSWRLEGCTLVVTLEPCVMCAGAALAARVKAVVFGCADEKAGAAGSMYDVLRDRRLPVTTTVVGGVMAAESAVLLREFFRSDVGSRT